MQKEILQKMIDQLQVNLSYEEEILAKQDLRDDTFIVYFEETLLTVFVDSFGIPMINPSSIGAKPMTKATCKYFCENIENGNGQKPTFCHSRDFFQMIVDNTKAMITQFKDLILVESVTVKQQPHLN